MASLLLLLASSVAAQPVLSKQNGQGKAFSADSGSYKWATLLCKFSNVPDEPHDRAWFDGLTGMEYPGVGHYWSEVSYGQLDLQGSRTYGWYNLSGTRSSYGSFANLDLQKLGTDCAKAADAAVNFREFQGLSLMFNSDLRTAAGGQLSLNLDGKSDTYGATWQGAPTPETCQCGNAGYDWQAIVAGEMEHALGIPWHSSGPYEETYDSYWDIGSYPGAGCAIDNAVYGCIGQHTIAYYKHVLGWIPDARRFEAPKGTTTATLRPLDTMPASDYLWAKVPIAGSVSQFYSV